MSNCFKVNTAKIAQEMIDGEVIIVNLDEGYYYSLMNTASEIWSGIERGDFRQQIITEMLNKYDESRETIEASVDSLIQELQDEEIILPVPESESTGQSSLQIDEQQAAPAKLKFEPPKLQKYTDMEDLLTLDPIHDVDETGWPNVKQG